MNKTFRTLWNHTRGCYVVSHEKANTQGKASSTRPLATLLLTACGVVAHHSAWAIADTPTYANTTVATLKTFAIPSSPSSVAVGATSGNIFVVDAINKQIVKISADGSTTTTLVDDSSNFTSTSGSLYGVALTTDESLLYVVDRGRSCVWKVDLTSTPPTPTSFIGDCINGNSWTPPLTTPSGIALDSVGDVYIADFTENCIRKAPKDAPESVAAYAGTCGAGGYENSATPLTAKFSWPWGMVFDAQDNLYVADQSNFAIRKIAANGGEVTTLLGGPTMFGWNDGDVATAKLGSPWDVKIDGSGKLYFVELNATNSNPIYRKLSGSTVTTLAGTATSPGFQDGPGSSAKFQSESRSIAVTSGGVLYAADPLNYKIRSISPSNSAPTASSVSISGTANVGQTLTGNYTYNDADGDTESGSTFQWKRDNDGDLEPIAGATGATHALTASDIGWQLKFCVTPKAGSGTATGTETCSSLSSAVSGGTLSGTSVTASSTRLAAENVSYTVNFTATNGVPASGSLFYGLFPEGTTLSGCENQLAIKFNNVEQTYNDVVYSCSADESELQVRTNSAIAAGTNISLRISGVSNPSSGESGAFSKFETRIGSRTRLDTANTMPSITYTSVAVPGKPLTVSATAGNQQATVNFTAPASDGGSSITGYLAVCQPENSFGSIDYPWASGTTSPLTVTGLTNGTGYYCYVRAQNTEGYSQPSDLSALITPTAPAAPPPAPINPFNPGGTSTVNVIPPAGTGTGSGYTPATNDLVTNLSNLNSQVGIADNGVVVILDNGLQEPVKFKDNPPNGVLIAMPSQKPVDVVLNGNTLNVKVDPETKPVQQTVVRTATIVLPDGKTSSALELVQGSAQIANPQPGGVLGGLELSRDTTLRGVTAQAGNTGGTAGFQRNPDTSGSVSADAGEVVLTVRLKATSPQTAKVNALAAGDTVTLTLKAGEVARFDAKGELIGVYAGSLSGTAGKTGDSLPLTSPAGISAYPAKSVKLDGNALDRLGGNLLPAFASVIGNTSNFAADGAAPATALVQDAATGIVTAKNANRADLSYYGLPVGDVTINPGTPDGIVWHTNGTVTWTVQGVSVTFAPVSGSLSDLAASAKTMGYTTQVLDNGAVKLTGSANYLVGLPRFHAQQQGLASGFAWDAKAQRASFTDAQGTTQLIDPVPLDGSQLDKAAAASPGWRIERDYFLYGAIRLKGPNGESYGLTPDYGVTLESSRGDGAAAYNGADGRLYFRYNTGFLPFSQGFTTK